MGIQKKVRFNIETDTLYLNSNAPSLSNMDMAFIRIGQDLYEHPEFNTDTDDDDKDANALQDNSVDVFSWSNTCIKDIRDLTIRDTCIVMFQAITLTNMWQRFDMNLEIQVKQILGTMQALGYVGEMERDDKLEQVLNVIQTIKQSEYGV